MKKEELDVDDNEIFKMISKLMSNLPERVPRVDLCVNEKPIVDPIQGASVGKNDILDKDYWKQKLSCFKCVESRREHPHKVCEVICETAPDPPRIENEIPTESVIIDYNCYCNYNCYNC